MSFAGIVSANALSLIVKDIVSLASQEVPMWNALAKLWPKMSCCDNWSEQRNGKVNCSSLILNVRLHSPLFLIKEPLAALILMLLSYSFVLFLIW